MILVTGGRAQGKRAFAKMQLCGGKTVCWVDGATASLKEMEAAEYCFNFQAFVRRVLGGEIQAEPGSWAGLGFQAEPGFPAAPEMLARHLLAASPGRVIVTDEIGSGIVPVSGEERYWREETGRICCCLAALSEQVWRVVCGIGTRIK